jgi:hypothetical protein
MVRLVGAVIVPEGDDPSRPQSKTPYLRKSNAFGKRNQRRSFVLRFAAPIASIAAALAVVTLLGVGVHKRIRQS